jgi:hypothetical protein
MPTASMNLVLPTPAGNPPGIRTMVQLLTDLSASLGVSIEAGFDLPAYRAAYPGRGLPRFATIDYYASVCTLVRAQCGELEDRDALTDDELADVDVSFFRGCSSVETAQQIIEARWAEDEKAFDRHNALAAEFAS